MPTLPAVGRAGTVRELKTPQGPTTKAERPEEAKQAEELEEEWNAMQVENEEDPWACMGMDDAEETPSGIPANAESREPAQVEAASDLEKE